MSAGRDVVITGLGVVSAAGIGHVDLWSALLAGDTALAPITLFDREDAPSGLAGEVPDLEGRLRASMAAGKVDGLDRATMLSLLACELALGDAGLHGECTRELGVVLGTAFGSLHSIGTFDRASLREDPNYMSPLGFPSTVLNAPASRLAIHHGMAGPNVTLSTGVIAGAQAIGYAADLVSAGSCDILLAGGVEELCAETFWGHSKLGLLSREQGSAPEACRPYDRGRNGMVLGEGAVLLVLERREQARARGARIYARIEGHACTAESDDVAGGGLRRSIAGALERAASAAADVGLVVGGGNGSRAGDGAELQAIEDALDESRGPVPLVSVKGTTGECLGCSPAMQAVVAALALREEIVPGTAGFRAADVAERCIRITSGNAPLRADLALVPAIDCDGASAALLLAREADS